MLRCARDFLIIVAITTFLSSRAGAVPKDNIWTSPSWVLPDLNGQLHKLRDWQGKVILLNFWASWCGSCQIELPHLVSYQRRYAKQGLQVIGIGLDDPKKLANVIRTLNIPYPTLYVKIMPGMELLRQLGNKSGALPYTVVIDRRGYLAFRHVGIFDQEAFELIVLPLLKENR
jgi:thiol-disulfide isomerase/thioredoxin